MTRIFLLLLILMMTSTTQAQIVDTWRFDSSQQQEKALRIASQLRCPQCQNQNLLESNAPVAVSMRHQVYTMVAEGKSEDEIAAWMTQRYGDFVLYNPPLTTQTLLLWGLPLLLLLMLALMLRRTGTRQPEAVLPESVAKDLTRELQQDLREPDAAPAPTRPLPVRLLCAATVLVILACLAGYGLTPRIASLQTGQQWLADPLQAFAETRTPERQLAELKTKIRATPQDSVLWATLGEYYLYRNDYDRALLAYQRALTLRGDNAELYAALATVLYYQSGQNMTPETRRRIDQALALDADEATALMLLAADAFMHADYQQAISLWQRLLDANNPRINRAQLVEAINMAKLLQKQH